MKCLALSLGFLLICFELFAQQETVVKGRVLEKGKPEELPFVSIFFKGSSIGTTSDFEGNFIIKTNKDYDTLVFSYVGYKTLKRKIEKGKVQNLIIEMQSNVKEMHEVIVRPKENPAIRIIKMAQKNREKNDPDHLLSYEYDSYNKMDVAMNNISEKMKENRMFRPIKELFDTSHQMKNEEGKYILPIFVSETYSKFYQNNNPSKSKEVIKANNISGFGVEQGSYVVDLIGTSILQFNFYKDWMRFLGKDFISPIAGGSIGYYIYTLVDSVKIDGLKCYEIKLNLRREEDLGFLGKMWITDSTYAIKQIQVEISKNANINFIDRLKIQQESSQTEAGPFLPVKTRVIIDVAQITEKSSGFVSKMYRANTAIKLNTPKPDDFFDVAVEREPNLFDHDSEYWTLIRTEPFSASEKKMLTMIDSVKKLPAVKTYLDIMRLVLEGYYRVGKIDYGPYLFLVGYNEVEHLRMRFGFRTNRFFSKDWFFRGYLAYGFSDREFKYGLGVDRILNHKHWTTLGVYYKNDYDILGITDISMVPVQGGGRSNLFAALSFASPGSRLNKTIDYRLVFVSQPKRDWTFRLSANNSYYAPLGSFVFAYKKDPLLPETSGNLKESYVTTALTGEIRYAYKEMMVSRGIDRVRLVRPKLPAVTVQYSRGIKGAIGGDFNYDKVQLNVEQHITTGKFGNANFGLVAGRIFGKLPYPLLDVARGNATLIYNEINYSLMNLYEFVADQYLHARYIQHFEGLFTNRIPLLRKWRVRNFALIKASYGSLSKSNRDIMPLVDETGKRLSPVYWFGNKPYAEAGFGFENIFRFVSVSYIKRLTYLSNANIRKWGINVGIEITF